MFGGTFELHAWYLTVVTASPDGGTDSALLMFRGHPSDVRHVGRTTYLFCFLHLAVYLPSLKHNPSLVLAVQELQQFCTSSGILRFTPANYEPQPPSAPTLPGSPPLHTVQLTFSCCEDDGDTVPVVTRASAHSVKAARQAAAKQALLHPAVLERLRQWWYETRYMAPKAEGEADTKMQLLAVLVDHAERAQRVKQQQLAPEGEYPLSQRMLQC